jgi:2-oxoglutarate ferredoxin oxidoreductase subunit beta
MIVEGIKHRGYALIDVLQPCVTFNHVNTYEWYRERVYHLEDAAYDPADRDAAWLRAHEWGDRIPVGILYRSESQATYEEQVGALKDGNPVSRLLKLSPAGQRECEALKQGFI